MPYDLPHMKACKGPIHKDSGEFLPIKQNRVPLAIARSILVSPLQVSPAEQGIFAFNGGASLTGFISTTQAEDITNLLKLKIWILNFIDQTYPIDESASDQFQQSSSKRNGEKAC